MTDMENRDDNVEVEGCLRRFVLWATRQAESVAEMIERRNMRVALRVVCHAQAWLRNLGYHELVNALEVPIREIAAATVKPSPQNTEARQPATENQHGN